MILLSNMKMLIPKNIIEKCINIYEERDLFLKKDEEYKLIKDRLLLKKYITYYDFNKFINESRGICYTNFIKLEKIFFNEKKCDWDIKFKKFLYIHLYSFYNGSYNDFIKIIKNNINKEYLIIDIRNNFGGNLNECLQICDILLSKCEIVKLNYKNKTISYYASAEKISFKKIIIFLNENTASCSEILALTLRKNLCNTVLIGKDTVGKSFGQSTFINKKYKYIFNITSFKWEVEGEDINNLFGYIKEDNSLNSSFNTNNDYYSYLLSYI